MHQEKGFLQDGAAGGRCHRPSTLHVGLQSALQPGVPQSGVARAQAGLPEGSASRARSSQHRSCSSGGSAARTHPRLREGEETARPKLWELHLTAVHGASEGFPGSRAAERRYSRLGCRVYRGSAPLRRLDEHRRALPDPQTPVPGGPAERRAADAPGGARLPARGRQYGKLLQRGVRSLFRQTLHPAGGDDSVPGGQRTRGVSGHRAQRLARSIQTNAGEI